MLLYLWLSIFAFLKTSDVNAQSDSLDRNSFLHWRCGLSSLHEINLGINPVPFLQNHFFLGIGYKHYPLISLDIKIPSERHFINQNLQGPIFSVGYDGMNRKGRNPFPVSIQFFYKSLKSDTITYIEYPFLFGEAHDDADYRNYWHEAKVFGLRCYFEEKNKNKWASFYYGLGCDFQFLTKHFIKSGTLGHAWPDNDVEEILYVYPRFDFGFRFSAMTKPKKS
jgi:hypothetical protein